MYGRIFLRDVRVRSESFPQGRGHDSLQRRSTPLISVRGCCYARRMAEKETRTVGGMVWKVVMVLVAIWLIIYMLRISGINVL